MKAVELGRAVAATLMLGVMVGCGSATTGSRPATAGEPAQVPAPPAQPITSRIPRLPITDADVHFMTGMIPHHAQAIVMSRMAPSHGARADVRILAERIIVSQRDEINMMRTWLRDNGKPVPDTNATHMRMNMGGVVHDMLMPGMLNEKELAQLDSARGPAFDRLFLTFMIRHHEGAIQMVDELFNTSGAGQDEIVFRFASDVFADQTSEIERMQRMLEGRYRPLH
jgi:uncharacterized protein (DUF305 family)